MTTGMPRMSDRPDWVPLKLFTEVGEFSVVEAPPQRRESPRTIALLTDPQR